MGILNIKKKGGVKMVVTVERIVETKTEDKGAVKMGTITSTRWSKMRR